MATGTPIDPAIKSEILQKVREEGLSVYKTAQIYNVNYRTIYGWIKKQFDGKDRNLILKNNRLKKELDTAYRIIGRLTAEVQRPKG